MRDHKELDVWKESVSLVTDIYNLASMFPPEEIYGLGGQIRRSSVSVPSNIAEGAARQTAKEFVHYLYIACGSLSELETQLIIARNLGYVADANPFLWRIASLRKMLHGLIRHCRNYERPLIKRQGKGKEAAISDG